MTKQCLFDPNHMIDQFGFYKHLKNCQSPMRKDWRQCKHNEEHWCLYKNIMFHQQYDCENNPMFIKNPKLFYQKRQQQIRRIQFQMKNKNKFKNKTNNYEQILTMLKDQPSFRMVDEDEGMDKNINIKQKENSNNNKNNYSSIDSSMEHCFGNFGDISIIQHNVNNNNNSTTLHNSNILLTQNNTTQHKNTQNISFLLKNNTNQNNSISSIKNVQSNTNNTKNIKSSNNNNQILSNNSFNNNISSGFNKLKKQQKRQQQLIKLWKQPDFCEFELAFRDRFIQKRTRQLNKQYNSNKTNTQDNNKIINKHNKSKSSKTQTKTKQKSTTAKQNIHKQQQPQLQISTYSLNNESQISISIDGNRTNNFDSFMM